MRTYLSWSEVSTWLNCQLQHKFKYIDGLRAQGPAGIELQMGSAAHEIFRAHYARLPGERELTTLEHTATVVYNKLDLSKDKYSYLREEQLLDMAKKIWSTWGRDDEIPRMLIETPVEAVGHNLGGDNRTYYCIPDAFCLRDGNASALLLSHKTALSKLPDEHTFVMFHPQARLEAWAITEFYKTGFVEVYFNLLTPKAAERVGPIWYTEETHQQTTEELRVMFQQVGRVGVIARPGPQCWRCEYRELHEIMTTGGDVEVAKLEW